MSPLTLFSFIGAYSTFEEDIKGQLRPGMLADIVVLDDDPRGVDPGEISKIPVRRTIIGGETVFEG